MMERTNHAIGVPAAHPVTEVPDCVEVARGVVEIQVAGIECAVCARRLADHLRKTRGVESALANPRTGLLRVHFRPSEISTANLLVEVRRAGFVPGGASALIRVSGMHCTHCATAVEFALGQRAGVEGVRADAVTGEVRVLYLPRKVSVAAIEEVIACLGYRVEPGEVA